MAHAPHPTLVAEQAKQQQQQQQAVSTTEAQPVESALDVDDNAELYMDQVRKHCRVCLPCTCVMTWIVYPCMLFGGIEFLLLLLLSVHQGYRVLPCCLATMTLDGSRSISACVRFLTLLAGLQELEDADEDDILYDDFDDEATMRELEALG